MVMALTCCKSLPRACNLCFTHYKPKFMSVLVALICVMLLSQPTNSSGPQPQSSFAEYRKIGESPGFKSPHNIKCEPITVPMCSDMPYNSTMFPNILNHDRQDDAGLEVHQFLPLVKVQCSPYLKLFLCAIYVPFCNMVGPPVKPCRELCEKAKDGCEELMRRFGFRWPETLNCQKFPPHGSKEQLCMWHNETDRPIPDSPRRVKTPRKNDWYPKPVWALKQGKNLTCPQGLWVPVGLKNYKLKIGDYTLRGRDDSTRCGAPCTDDMLFFPTEQRHLIQTWIGVWAFLCMFSTLFTVLTFLINRRRFRYPERPIIFLSICYFMVGLSYVVGFLIKDNQVACNQPFTEMNSNKEATTDKIHLLRTVVQGTKNEWCTILFLVLYYFSMAASLWWIVLCLTWLLAAGLKWSTEGIENRSQYFHLVCWALPAMMCIAILITQGIEGDVLANVCYVGVYDTVTLRWFVVAPLLLFLGLGALFLVIGVFALFKIRTMMKNKNSSLAQTDRFEKLMMRIGLFSVLYIVASGATIGCYFYESSERQKWMTAWYLNICRHASGLSAGVQSPYANMRSACPSLSHNVDLTQFGAADSVIFMIKYFSILIVGPVSSIWIWNSKSLREWSSCCYNFATCNCAGGGDRHKTEHNLLPPQAHL